MSQAKAALVLPDSIVSLRAQYFTNLALTKILQLSSDPSKLNPAQRVVTKYSANGVLNGRSLNSVIIFMAGASGSGKSSTINALFDDPSLCKTCSSTSETKDVSIITKTLTITAESPAFQASLRFVDVPGTFDTDAQNEAKNMALIRKYRKTTIELADRTGMALSLAPVRKSVFPNIVLFVASASDKRMAGSDSVFARSLKTFQKTANLIDIKKQNVIVVLTHAMALPRKKEKFIARLDEIRNTIQTQFRTILDIPHVDVIPVENEPEDYDLEKTGDFYQLPNGELSHLNLFQAMLRCFDMNNDILGRLLVSTYFGKNCPEKPQKAQVVTFNENSSDTEVNQLARELETWGSPSGSEVTIPHLHFQSLAHGFCPVTEEVKPVTPLSSLGEFRTVEIEKTKFGIPKYVQVYANRQSRFQKLSFMEKNEYQMHMQHKYGLEAGYKLMVTASSEGRWLTQSQGSSNSKLISMVQEIQVATFKLETPNSLQQDAAFAKELNGLPEAYNQETASHFQAFFSRWGSHMIVEQGIGGAIQLNCIIESASLSKEQLQEVEVKVSGAFKNVFSASVDYNFSDGRRGLREIGVSNEHLRINGGNPPEIIDWNTVSSEELQAWAKSVAQNPTELQTSLKLYPYYNFLSFGNKYTALRTATEEYVSNTLSQQIQKKIQADRDRIAQEESMKAITAPPPKNCFPKGAMVSLANGMTEIENLEKCVEKLKTIALASNLPLLEQMKLGNTCDTTFCTYLDRQDNILLEYLELEFDNGKILHVSPGHMIFQCTPKSHCTVVGKQAKNFVVGDRAAYIENRNDGDAGTMETPEICRISKKLLHGAYSPLTSTGTLIVDGFLVSSYANTDSFHLAQAALLPLKIWSKIGKRKYLEKTSAGIHPYGKFLISFRKRLTSFF